ncbi:PVC-type heme-binding CxxCH protein [Pirellulaceae bacterium SH467]
MSSIIQKPYGLAPQQGGIAWRTVLSGLLSLCILVGLKAPVFSQDSVRVLLLGDRGHHRPSDFYRAIREPLQKNGIAIEYTEDISSALSKEKLSGLDALMVYANINEVSPEQEAALLEYVENGGAYVPVHCASYCFLNSPKLIALTGAQFKEHGGERFRTVIVAPDHELMKGFDGFESWDETYVHHKHNPEGRVVLETRRQGRLAPGTTEEPWTWTRTQGKGRVFYTAWGHNMDTWSQPGFVNLLERGIRWAAKKSPEKVAPFRDATRFNVPKMTEISKDLPAFTYTNVGNAIPNYRGRQRSGDGDTILSEMQNPLLAAESVKRYSTPVDFSLRLWACEDDSLGGSKTSSYAGLAGKALAMNWDHRGRLWLCETIDYPNELQPVGKGRDRIRICEDTDRDGVADKFTVFASGLSIPTAIVCYRGGAIVQDGTTTVYLKDTDGDDVADFRQELITGWAMGDTHGGVSNFQYGLDNWIWGMQGYNDSRPVINGERQQGFRQGFWRFAVKAGASDDTAPVFAMKDGKNTLERSSQFDQHSIRVSKLEFVRSTNNNTWGIGISEEGLIFGSTANGNPSNFMPISNRYYERVNGWSPEVLKTIADTFKFQAITPKVRQVDFFDGYTAGAGHALYTARNYPKEWWNRLAFVCEPTGHLVGSFVLNRDGAGYKSTSPFNLVASVDEWSSPTMAEIGPDGNVWVIDWYNFIVQHNPTPQGFKTGRGNAYESELRDKKHARIYRVVYEGNEGLDKALLEQSDALVRNGLDPNNESQLVAALKHPNFLWRRAAQRLLIEKGSLSETTLQALNGLIQDKSIDSVGLNVGAIHALWVLQGIGSALPTAAAVEHPSPAVRRNGVQTAQDSLASLKTIADKNLLLDEDPQVRLTALLKVADSQATEPRIVAALANPSRLASLPGSQRSDTWLLDAWTSAASVHWKEVLPKLLATKEPQSSEALARISIVAEHASRSRMSPEAFAILGESPSQMEVAGAIVSGIAKGWPREYEFKAPEGLGAKIASVWLKTEVPVEVKSQVLMLANNAGIQEIADALAQIVGELATAAIDSERPIPARIAAAKQAMVLQSDSTDLVTKLLEALSAQSSPDLVEGVLQSFATVKIDGLAKLLMSKSNGMPPEFRRNAIRLLMARPQTTNELLDLIDSGSLSWNDFQLDQKQALRDHPTESVRTRANELLKSKGLAMNADRQKVVESWMEITHEQGDLESGKAMYAKHCALCHVHGTMGVQIGPNLTGMAVHPKEELLVHILDPSRSVEGNFRTYSIRTVDDTIVTGMLAGESKTSLEIITSQAKKEVVLREDIDQLIASQKSLMPEGFENQMTKVEMRDLLEFLTSKGKYVPLAIDTVATSITTKGMFFDEAGMAERLVFRDWGVKTFKEVPFTLVDPQRGTKPNAIMLHGPYGNMAPKMPKRVELPCKTSAVAIHMLSGIGGWSYPASAKGSKSLIVRLTYEDGKTEDHDLINGEHFADYIQRVDVPQSEFAFNLNGRQLRYLSIKPRSKDPLAKLELIKGNDVSAPIVMAITVQTTE